MRIENCPARSPFNPSSRLPAERPESLNTRAWLSKTQFAQRRRLHVEREPAGFVGGPTRSEPVSSS